MDRKKILKQYYLIKEYRKKNLAPVDTIGTEAQVRIKHMDPEDRKFRLFFSLMLSVQTNDIITDRVMTKIDKTLKGISLKKFQDKSAEQIQEMIKEVNYSSQKSKFLHENISKLSTKSRMPTSLEEVMELKGVGRKIGLLYMQIAFKQINGIAVDTHCHRIPNRLKWCSTTNAVKTSEFLETAIPKREWKNVNEVLVGFGQTICQAKIPKCDICPINKLCIAKENYTTKKIKVSKKEKEEVSTKDTTKILKTKQNQKKKKIKLVMTKQKFCQNIQFNYLVYFLQVLYLQYH